MAFYHAMYGNGDGGGSTEPYAISSFPFDLKTITDKWSEVTVDNFFFKIDNTATVKVGSGGSTGGNYTSATLTISNTNFYNSTSGTVSSPNLTLTTTMLNESTVMKTNSVSNFWQLYFVEPR